MRRAHEAAATRSWSQRSRTGTRPPSTSWSAAGTARSRGRSTGSWARKRRRATSARRRSSRPTAASGRSSRRRGSRRGCTRSPLNLCRDRLRRRRGRTHVSLDELRTTGELAVLRTTARRRSSCSRRATSPASGGRGRCALPEEQREVIVLKEYQGLTFLEIAEVAGRSGLDGQDAALPRAASCAQRLEREGIQRRGARARDHALRQGRGET